jgi:GDP-4-dehydro-6-deoxy-D-mannose reductase
MSILVTGGSGSLGFHLLNLLPRNASKIYAFHRSSEIPHRHLEDVKYIQGDLLEANEILNVIKEIQPSEVYHIASQSNVGISHRNPQITLNVNIIGTLNLLEAIRKESPKTRVLLLSSSDVYGPGTHHLDTLRTEEDPFIPLTPFATSKAAMEILGKQYITAWDMHISFVRPFNFTGPLHSRKFVLPSITAQLINIQKYGAEPIIYTGNIDVSRDYIDMRDLARALVLVMKNSESGEIFNICSGQVRTVRELIDTLIGYCEVDVELCRDPSLERKTDQPLLAGSAEKLMKRTGWKPLIKIEDSLFDLYQEMQQRIQREITKKTQQQHLKL